MNSEYQTPHPDPLICVIRRIVRTNLSFTQFLDSMSFRLGFQNLKLFNLKAAVTHQK